jgi:16S rRNA (adenine1518-N6/adenine1519-N6)-dimethyltransferase
MSPKGTTPLHRARRRFGQNFLVDETIIGQIITAIGARADHHLIEIGPGTAALTQHLLQQCPSLQAVELDRNLIVQLRSRFANYSDFVVHSGDALKIDYRQFYRGQPLRLVGNLPYNISTPLLFHLLAQREVIADMHFMLQREVVDRMSAAAGSKSYGRLSVMVQYHCRVLPLIPVPPSAFQPAPRVQSAFVRLVPHAKPPALADNETRLAQVVAECFQHRRKTLRNGLKALAPDIPALDRQFDLGRRPEQLSVADFVALSNAIGAAEMLTESAAATTAVAPENDGELPGADTYE